MAGTLGSSHGSNFNTDFGSNLVEDAIVASANEVEEIDSLRYESDEEKDLDMVVEEKGADGAALGVSSLNQAEDGEWRSTQL